MARRKPLPTVVSRLVAAKAAANELGIPYTTLRDRTFAGDIPVIKVGRAWYYDRKDLDAFIERHKEKH
jgi:excisionase family DNA binding protein